MKRFLDVASLLLAAPQPPSDRLPSLSLLTVPTTTGARRKGTSR